MKKVMKINAFGIILIIVIIFEYFYQKLYHFCLRCYSISDIKCDKCSLEMIFRGLIIMPNDKTLEEIIKYNKSISRFGDGEYRIIYGEHAAFQKYDKNLSKGLLHVLNSKEKNLLVGINIPYKKKMMEERSFNSRLFWNSYFPENKFKIAKIIDKNKIYYSSCISRFYSVYNDKTKTLSYINKLKKIWDKRDVLIIEGEKTRVGIGNDLLNNTKSIKRIICPERNAFDIYNKIIECSLKFDKKTLILIALGPTASLLAFDLYKFNYQVIDIGHVDIEYELYLRKANGMIKIPNKYVSEVPGGNKNISNITDKIYYDQIAFNLNL